MNYNFISISSNQPSENPELMTINEFKQLVINDLINFVLKQNHTERKTDTEWAELYCDWLEKELN